jgi:hypothetical protein
MPLGLYMHPMGLVCPLGALSCLLGLNYAPWGSFMLLRGQVRAPSQACAAPLCVRAPPLCVYALGSFKPLEAHICSLEAHSCPLGLNYAPWDSFMHFGGQVRTPPQACAPPPLCVCALGYFKPLEAHVCPWGAQLCPLGVKCIPNLKHAPPLMRVCPPYVCASWILLSPLRLIYVP